MRFFLHTLGKSKIKARIAFWGFACCIPIAHAQAIIPAPIAVPESCEYGRDSADTDVTLSLDDWTNAQTLSNSYTGGDWDDGQYSEEDQQAAADLAETFRGWWNNFDYLKIEGPKYVLQNRPTQFKANTFQIYDYVSFFSLEDGYIARDKSNLQADAYKSITFDSSYGPSLVWITNNNLCSAKGVWVQKAPTVTRASYIESTGQVTFDVTIDRYSKNIVNDRSTLLSIKYGDRYITTFNVSGTSGRFSFNIFDYAYEFGSHITATVTDGTFTAQSPPFYATQPSSGGNTPVVDTSVPNKLLYSTGPYGSYSDPDCYWIENTTPKERRFFCGPIPVASWKWTGADMFSNCTITPFEGFKHIGGCPTAIKLEKIL